MSGRETLRWINKIQPWQGIVSIDEKCSGWLPIDETSKGED
jgi:hypothetical protein